MRCLLLYLTFILLPCTYLQAQGFLRFTAHVRFGNATAPQGPGNFIQTSCPSANKWGVVFPEPRNDSTGDMLCIAGDTFNDNDGCYTITVGLWDEVCRWVVVLDEAIPQWAVEFYEVQVTWVPRVIFIDGFESGDLSAWSRVVGGS